MVELSALNSTDILRAVFIYLAKEVGTRFLQFLQHTLIIYIVSDEF